MITFLQHHRVSLALHELRGGPGRPLLMLHGLGSRTPIAVPLWADGWTGPVLGLDFTGHGASTVPVGGGYSAEVLMGDADMAVNHIGECTVVGQGLGGYIALLIAGARPAQVRGAIIADGPGISGGVPGPASSAIVTGVPEQGKTPDRWALLELSRDPRPADYAMSFVRQAAEFSGIDMPIAVTAQARPQWLRAVAEDPCVLDTTMPQALATFNALDELPTES
jgi:pimeloyl-ACP methyl ester carboxylesterase